MPVASLGHSVLWSEVVHRMYESTMNKAVIALFTLQ